MAEEKIRTIKLAPPPTELPVHGRVKPNEVTFIGRTNYEGALEVKKFIFGIRREDRRRHVYVIGKAGSGKSKALEMLARQDIAFEFGLCYIDPSGDVFNSLLNFVPKERIQDVVAFDPTDTAYPISFNPFAGVKPEFKYHVAQELVEVMEGQFGTAWNKKLEYLFRFTVLALLDYAGSNFRSIQNLLTNRVFRQKVAAGMTDTVVKQFWALEFDEWSKKNGASVVLPLLNKVNHFLSNPFLGHVLSQKTNTLDFSTFIQDRKICLVNLARSTLGYADANFLGALLMVKLLEALRLRVRQGIATHGFHLYLDDVPSLLSKTFLDLLRDSGHFGVSIVVAHRYLAEISPLVQAALMSHAGNVIAFRLTGSDAMRLESEFAPIFRARDMINLGTREFYIKMTIAGTTFDPFSAETLQLLTPPHPSWKVDIIGQSRKNYARPLSEVEQELAGQEQADSFSLSKGL